MSAPLSPLGAPPRVTISKVVRTQYRIEWEYDGYRFAHDDESGGEYIEVRKRGVKYTAANRKKVYQMAALRLVYARATPGGREACSLCGDGPSDEPCRYHGGPGFKEIVERLARWLQWRDAR